jgi:hypothetical protein
VEEKPENWGAKVDKKVDKDVNIFCSAAPSMELFKYSGRFLCSRSISQKINTVILVFVFQILLLVYWEQQKVPIRRIGRRQL